MIQQVLRAGFRALSVVSPSVAARLAERLWFRVPPSKVSAEARAFLATGEKFTVNVDGHDVTCWRWGERSAPTVLLMHGWGGNAGQFRSLIDALVQRGMGAVTFDALSHGQSGPSAWGKRYATLFEFAEAVRAITPHIEQLAGVVAHSGGCAAVAWAMKDDPAWQVPKVVFVAPFGRPGRYVEQFQQMIGLSDEATRRFREDSEKRFQFTWKELEVPELATLRSVPPTLVVHDREDKETSWQDGADIAAAWPGARLITTTGLGHNRVLYDPEVLQEIVGFLG